MHAAFSRCVVRHFGALVVTGLFLLGSTTVSRGQFQDFVPNEESAPSSGIYLWGNSTNNPASSGLLPGEILRFGHVSPLGGFFSFTAQNNITSPNPFVISGTNALRFGSNGGHSITLTGNTIRLSSNSAAERAAIQLYGATDITIANTIHLAGGSSAALNMIETNVAGGGHANLTFSGQMNTGTGSAPGVLYGGLHILAPTQGTSNIYINHFIHSGPSNGGRSIINDNASELRIGILEMASTITDATSRLTLSGSGGFVINSLLRTAGSGSIDLRDTTVTLMQGASISGSGSNTALRIASNATLISMDAINKGDPSVTMLNFGDTGNQKVFYSAYTGTQNFKSITLAANATNSHVYAAGDITVTTIYSSSSTNTLTLSGPVIYRATGDATTPAVRLTTTYLDRGATLTVGGQYGTFQHTNTGPKTLGISSGSLLFVNNSGEDIQRFVTSGSVIQYFRLEMAGGEFHFQPHGSGTTGAAVNFSGNGSGSTGAALGLVAGQSTIRLGDSTHTGQAHLLFRGNSATSETLSRALGRAVGGVLQLEMSNTDPANQSVRFTTSTGVSIGIDGLFLGGTVLYNGELAKYQNDTNGVRPFTDSDYTVKPTAILPGLTGGANITAGRATFVRPDAGVDANVANGDQFLAGLKLQGNTTITTSGTGVLQFAGPTNNGGTMSNSGGTILVSGGTNTINTNVKLDGNDRARDLIIHVTNSAGLHIAGAISRGVGTNNAMLTKAGEGTLTLSGTNSYHGNYIVGGTVAVTSSTALGADTAGLTFSGTGRLLALGNLDLSANRTVNILSSTLANFDTGAFSVEVAGKISGAGGLRKTGSGLLILANNDSVLANQNTFSGGLEINNGTVRILADHHLGLAPTIALEMTSNITFSGTGGTLQVGTGGSNFTLGTKRWIALHGDATATFDVVESARTVTIAGNIWDGGALEVGHLTKSGAGTVVLAGENSYKGLTNVDAGTLALASGSTYVGAVNVNAGGTLRIDTTNTFTGGVTVGGAGSRLHLAADIDTPHSGVNVVTINSGGTLSGEGSLGGLALNGGTLSPGNSPGTIVAAATNVTSGTYQWEINSLTGGPGGDVNGDGWDFWDAGVLSINGPLTIAIHSLDSTNSNADGPLDGWDAFQDGQSWWIAQNTFGAYNFADALLDGYLLVDDSQFAGYNTIIGYFWLSTAGAGGTELWLNYSTTAIPEPGSLLLLSLAAGGLGIHRLRRRRQKSASAE